jgi:hypothetical protein
MRHNANLRQSLIPQKLHHLRRVCGRERPPLWRRAVPVAKTVTERRGRIVLLT